MENDRNRLIAPQDRRINYLRISVTDRCNLRCVYCRPREDVPKLSHKDILTYEEILRLAEVAIDLGIVKIRLTGGEPLLRKGIFDFIPKLTNLPDLKEVSLTTNGIYLKDHLHQLRAGGIRRLNVSLDTLDRDKYIKITGYDGFQLVWEGIEHAKELGFSPIKINVVPIPGLNDGELLDFAALSTRYPYHIRFIERMPMGTDKEKPFDQCIPNSLVKEKILSLGELIPVVKTELDGPGERFKLKGAPGEIGFISPMTNHFCNQCNRLRITAAGKLRVCLLSDHEEDVKGPMRSGASDEELKQIFLKAVSTKPREHQIGSCDLKSLHWQMSSIGG